MRRIEIDNGTESMVYATNDHDGGVFVRPANSGAYSQQRGNSDTPTFTSKRQFRAWLRRNLGVRGREVFSFGW